MREAWEEVRSIDIVAYVAWLAVHRGYEFAGGLGLLEQGM